MTTSGTYSQTTFRTSQVIEHAFRRCRINPEQITPELVKTAQDVLYLRLSALANQGIPLWAIKTHIVPLYEGVYSVECPQGVADVLTATLRTLQRLTGTASSSEGDAALAFDGDIETSCTQTLADGYIQVEFDSAYMPSTFGVLPSASGTWSFEVRGSNDDFASYDVLLNVDEETVVAGEWIWRDVQGLSTYQYVRLVGTDGTILDVAEFVVANMPNEINLALINRQDYFYLPDKTFLGQPTQFWLDRQRDRQVMQLWPAPAAEFTFAQLMVQAQMYIQDVGSMTQTLDIPQRQYDSVVWLLAEDLAAEVREVPIEVVPIVAARARAAWAQLWQGESDSAPTKFTPGIRPYTR